MLDNMPYNVVRNLLHFSLSLFLTLYAHSVSITITISEFVVSRRRRLPGRSLDNRGWLPLTHVMRILYIHMRETRT